MRTRDAKQAAGRAAEAREQARLGKGDPSVVSQEVARRVEESDRRIAAAGAGKSGTTMSATFDEVTEAEWRGQNRAGSAVDRDEANRFLLAHYMAGYLTTIDDATAEIARLEDLWNTGVCDLDECDAERQQLAEWRIRKTYALELMGGLTPLADRLDDAGQPTAYLMLLRPEVGGSGQVVVAVGNPDTASHVVIYVPGIRTDIRKPMDDVERAERLYQDGINRGKNVSSLFWLGYDSPKLGIEAATEYNANDGGIDLSKFLIDRRQTHVGSPAHQTVLAHSYGSLVTGKAGLNQTLFADEVILIGSPGTGVAGVDSLHIVNKTGDGSFNKREHVWASTMVGDPVGCLKLPTTDCKNQIIVPLWGHFNVNPIHPNYGAKRFYSGATDGLIDPHSAYWDAGMPSREKFADIAFEQSDPSDAARIMVVGDSISHGMEGDYTWRYRLKEHFERLSTPVDFVGPYRGTIQLREADQVGTNANGAYGPGNMTFDSEHFAMWGWSAAYAWNQMAPAVSTHDADYLLVELGFNDLTWLGRSPADVRDSIRGLIENARAGNPDISVLVANVVHRTPLGAVQPNLDERTDAYNALLAELTVSMNTSRSMVRYVDISSDFNPYEDAYDGLHPNGVGEYKIAKAFADSLAAVGLGGNFGGIPGSVESFTPDTPSWIQAVPTDAGMVVKWEHSYGARGYRLYAKNATVNFLVGVFDVGADSWFSNWVWKGHTYEYYVVPVRDGNSSGSLATASAVANPKTSLGPTDIKLWPGNGFVDLQWTPPTGEFSESVAYYKVMWLDESVPGSWLQTETVAGTSARISGLVNGHRYSFWMASINNYGEGWPSGAGAVFPGASTPAAPALTAARLTTPYDVHLEWTPVAGATGYRVMVRNTAVGEQTFALLGVVAGTSHDVGWLFEGAGAYEWCVVAINGNATSPPSNCKRSTITAPRLWDARITDQFGVRLEWDPVVGAGGYTVHGRDRVANPNGAWQFLGTTDSTQTFRGVALPTDSDRWEFYVTAGNNGAVSNPSNVLGSSPA